MKLYRGCDISPGVDGTVCRQARLRGAIMATIVGGAFVGGAIAAWWFEVTFFLVVNSIVAVVVVAALLSDVRARFRPTNWVLWIRPGSLWINLRSYQDRSPLDKLSIVELASGEVAEVSRHDERYTTGSGGKRTSNRLLSLDIRLREPDDGTLSAALKECRRADQPWRKFLFMRHKSRLTVYSVSLPQPDLVRIAWWGGRGHGISPGLSRTLRLLETRLHVAEPTRVNRSSGTDRAGEDDRSVETAAARAELDDQILSLVSVGNRMDAIRLLVDRRGYSLTEAKHFVDELAERV